MDAKTRGGVARQYGGQLGKQESCRVAVSLSVATENSSLPIAYRLYLPEIWAQDSDRREPAGVPEEIRFPTKLDQKLGTLLCMNEAAFQEWDAVPEDSQALPDGLRPGFGAGRVSIPPADSSQESGATNSASPVVFSGSESGVTSLAGFAGAARPHLPGGRNSMPASLRYVAAVPRRIPVAFWIRRNDHPRRPRAMTCCFCSSLKTLLTANEANALTSRLTSWVTVYRGPVLR
jgi:hypothetical protein